MRFSDWSSDVCSSVLVGIGADEVIVAGEGDNFAHEVRDLTGGDGVDIVVDNVGSRVFDACFDSLAVNGRYARVGQLFGDREGVVEVKSVSVRVDLGGRRVVRKKKQTLYEVDTNNKNNTVKKR